MTPTPPSEKSYWLDKPRNVDKIFRALIAVCGLLVLADAFYVKDAHFEMETVFGSYAWYGFVCCVGLVLAAKEMRKHVKRDEDYYDKN